MEVERMAPRKAKASPPRVSFGPASDHLAAQDDDWAGLIARVGAPAITLQVGREPYEALVRAIAHQQLHGRAAEAILGRVIALYPGTDFPSPDQLLTTDEAALRACGFSLAKIATARGIAAGARDGLVPTRREAETLSDEDLIIRLTALRGVGRWTVEMLLMFTLARPDILPVDDFGVREGWRILKGLPAQPKPKALAETGLAWSPYRTTAAWYLWRAAEQGRNTKPSEVTG
jgi:DNA-3-methyladenine glycosylase II